LGPIRRVNSPIVIKYGGSAMDDPRTMNETSRIISEIIHSGFPVLVVHGGGKEISRWQERLGLEAKFIEGIRYTDEASLELTEMLLSGTINKRVVSYLNRHGISATGISGRDCQLFQMSRVENAGHVGEVQKVRDKVLIDLLSIGLTPCISPISEDSLGSPLNVNADEAARAVAEALQADELIYLSDVDGLKIGGALVERCSASELESLILNPEVTGGMIPKLKSTLSALQNGVKRVRFLNALNPESIKRAVLNNERIGSEFFS